MGNGKTQTGYNTFIPIITYEVGKPSPTHQHVVYSIAGRLIMNDLLVFKNIIRVGITVDLLGSPRW